MRIEKPTNEVDEPFRPTSAVPPPNYSTRAIRLRLFTLFGMLILVIVLMKEAGKPERWEWMGFENEQKIQLDSKRPDSQQDDGFDAEPVDLESPLELDTPLRVGGNSAVLNAEPPLDSLVAAIPNGASDGSYPSAGVAFWGPLFRKMSANQQQTLLLLLKSMRQGSPVPKDRQEMVAGIVDILQRKRQEFHQQLFDQLAIAPNGSTEKTKLANDLYESQDTWDKKIFPAMSAAARREEITISQQQAIVRLQRIIDPLLLQQVQDRTSIGWTGDSGAWKRLWEKTLFENPPKFDPVTRIQLISQPDVYRGKPVSVEGWVRSARRETLSADSEIGIPNYYILWVRPKESKLGPYCVYSKSLPAGFPQVSDQFTDVNQHVRIDGYFFKVRTYVAGDSTVSNSPVIIARSLVPIEAVSFTSVNRWQPSRTTLFALLALIPVVATGLAWWAFRTSETARYVPGGKTEQRINTSLEELVGDPRVQTDREKIMSLYETDTPDE